MRHDILFPEKFRIKSLLKPADRCKKTVNQTFYTNIFRFHAAKVKSYKVRYDLSELLLALMRNILSRASSNLAKISIEHCPTRAVAELGRKVHFTVKRKDEK